MATKYVLNKNKDTLKEITTTTYDNGVVDVSLIDYMRAKKVKFKASGLRPNRRVYFFFDNVDVTDYIIQANRITLSENDDVTVFEEDFGNTDILTASTGNTASVISVGRYFDFANTTPGNQDDASRRARKRMVNLTDTNWQWAVGQGFTATSGVSGTISAIEIFGGETLDSFFASSSSNTIVLPKSTSHLANNYWGTSGANSIILMPHKNRKGRKVRAYITGFDNVSRTLKLHSSNTASALGNLYANDEVLTSNTGTEVGWSVATNGFYTDFEGKISGVFKIPGGLFKTGDRVFRIIDEPSNDADACTTRAEYTFTSQGLKQTKNETTIKSVKTLDVSPAPPVTIPERTAGGPAQDPVAQTFFVNASEHPSGIFLTAVGLYFYNKDELLPVKVQIRPTVNGYPHTSEVIKGSKITIDSDKVNTSTDASLETKAKFEQPIYLPPGEYAIVVLSDSTEYEIFVNELGGTILGTNSRSQKQPYAGSFFKSQNSSTWDAIQLEDMTFKLYKAVFSTTATLTMANPTPDYNVAVDTIFTHIEDTKIPNTSITYTHSYDSGSNYVPYTPDKDFVAPTGRITLTSNAGYRVAATLTTTDTDVSPIVHTDHIRAHMVMNQIDNADISAEDIVITNGGSGYIAGANILINITSSNGSGAVIYAGVDGTGVVSNVYVVSGGSGYIGDITFTANGNTGITSASINAASGTTATLAFNRETGAYGGPAMAKWISKPVQLAEGFIAGDMRLFLSAYKPSGTDIKVYYKTLNTAEDSSPFSDKSWVLMKQKTMNSLYSLKENFNDILELEFRPFETSLSTYNQFAIKLVLTSSDTTVYPMVYDMRAIALPAEV